MDISELLKDSYKKTIVIASNIIQGDSSHFISCYKLCNQGNLQIAARAARVIDECIEHNPDLMALVLDDLCVQVIKNPSSSVRRTFLRILKRMHYKCSEMQISALIDHCYEILLSQKVEVAFKTYAFDILLNQAKFHPELLSELKSMIETKGQNKYSAFTMYAERKIDRYKNLLIDVRA